MCQSMLQVCVGILGSVAATAVVLARLSPWNHGGLDVKCDPDTEFQEGLLEFETIQWFQYHAHCYLALPFGAAPMCLRRYLGVHVSVLHRRGHCHWRRASSDFHGAQVFTQLDSRSRSESLGGLLGSACGRHVESKVPSSFMQHHNIIVDVRDQLSGFAAAECPSHKNRPLQEEKFQPLMENATANCTHAVVGQHQFNADEGDLVPLLGDGRFRMGLLFGGLNTKTATGRLTHCQA